MKTSHKSSPKEFHEDLNRAWQWREERGVFRQLEACRVFHGAGEGRGPLQFWAVDRFQDHYWITQWEDSKNTVSIFEELTRFCVSKNARSVVGLGRPEQGVPALPKVLHGQPPEERFLAREVGGSYLIQMMGARHPGLFMDHSPLRAWLKDRAQGWRVLNTFAYTGSLSVTCGNAGAAHVTTLDLSKATVAWAQENWIANQLLEDRGRFISGDVFEWLPRLKREKQMYDCVILDPPSFSRGKKSNFSTAKDLEKLHTLALELVERGGVLVTSINSANVTWDAYQSQVLAAAQKLGRQLEVLERIDQPDTFPTLLSRPQERYLKGWILRVI